MPDIKGSYDNPETENDKRVRTLPQESVPQVQSDKKESVLTKIKTNSKFSSLSTEKKAVIIVAVLAIACVVLALMLFRTSEALDSAKNDNCDDVCKVSEADEHEEGLTYTENPGCDLMKLFKSETLSLVNNGVKGEQIPIYLFSCKYPKGEYIPAEYSEEREFSLGDIVDRGELDAFGNYTGHHQESGLSGTCFYVFGAFDDDGTCHGVVIIEDELYKGTGLYPKIKTKTVTDMCGCDYIGTVNRYFLENYKWNPTAETIEEELAE